MLLKINFLFIFALFFLSVKCQTDTTYIKAFDLNFNIKASLDQKQTFFTVKDQKNEDVIRTHRSPNIGFGITLRDYSISINKSLDFVLPKTSRLRTQTLEFEYHGYKKRFIYDFFLQNHTGYEISKNRSKDYYFSSDLKTKYYGTNFYYVFNHNKFSYRAIFSQNEKQIKNSGSFLLGSSIFYSEIRSDSVVISDEIGTDYKNLQIGLSAGYAYTWVFRYMQASASAIVGGNIGNNYPSSFFRKKLFIYPTVNARFGVVYTKREDQTFGLTVVVNSNYIYYKENYSISLTNLQMMFSYVKRFNWGNKFVNKNIDRINNAKGRLGF